MPRRGLGQTRSSLVESGVVPSALRVREVRRDQVGGLYGAGQAGREDCVERKLRVAALGAGVDGGEAPRDDVRLLHA